MKIVISAKGKNEDSILDKRFGRAENYLIFDTESKEYNVIENTAKEGAHGAGPRAAQLIIDSGAKVVITGNVGPRALAVIEETDIKVYEGINSEIKNNINEYLNNNLSEITEAGPSHAGN